MAQRSVPAPFLIKTYEMVDDRSTDDVISWNGDETSFVVWKTDDFAKDLLPKYFKHNNFSSFIRQLNTYGFRKAVPDKWEFANENFRKNQRELMSEIRRRKPSSASKISTVVVNDEGNSGNTPSSPSNSGEDLGSTSTASHESKDHQARSVETSMDFSGENEKLKRDNERILTELTQAKKQCDELMTFLTQYEKLEPGQINYILPAKRSSHDDDRSIDEQSDLCVDDRSIRDDDDNQSLKLFGVWLNKNNKKRDREENTHGPHCAKEMKTAADCHRSPLIVKTSNV